MVFSLEVVQKNPLCQVGYCPPIGYDVIVTVCYYRGPHFYCRYDSKKFLSSGTQIPSVLLSVFYEYPTV